MDGIAALAGTAKESGPQTFYYPPPLVHRPKPGYFELVVTLKNFILDLVSNRDLITNEARVEIARLIKDIYFQIQYYSTEKQNDFIKFLNLKIPEKTLRSIVESCSDHEEDKEKKQILRYIKRYLLVAGASAKMKGLFLADIHDKIPHMTLEEISYYFYTEINK